MTDPQQATDPLLAKADALIRRHRTFVANPSAAVTPPDVAPMPEVPSDDDIPTLTEVVDEALAQQGSSAVMIDRALSGQEQAIRQAIERWVDESLPDAILHVLDGFTDRLIAAVSERARQELLASLERDALTRLAESGEIKPGEPSR